MMMTETEKRKQIMHLLNDNVFVEAGAGAGKTTLIVSRIINQLKHGILPIEIVVITFTNAAAEELRGRIIERVRIEAKSETLSDGEKENLERALRTLDLMNISTIHSFCFKMLKERSFDSKIPMNVKLLDEKAAMEQYDYFFTGWVGRLSRSDWQELEQCGGKRSEIIEKTKSFFMNICELPEGTRIEFPYLQRNPQTEIKPLLEEFAEKLCSAAAKMLMKPGITLSEIPEERLGAGGKKIRAIMLDPNANYQELPDKLISGGKLQNFLKGYTKKELKEKGLLQLASQFDIKAEEEDCKVWWENKGKPEMARHKRELEDAAFGKILEYAVKARMEYRRTRPLDIVTNDHLLQKTHQLICESKEARDYFADRICCLYVDEFQDTDHIQEEFIWKLAADKEDENKLRDGALFLVGDPKQSIYRFRGAEPQVYFEAKKKMSNLENAKVYCLDNNFRSNERIIQWVNKSFAKAEITANEPYRAMIHQKKLPELMNEKTLAGVYYYRNPEGSGNTNYEMDAKDLTDLICNLVDGACKITDYDGKNQNAPYEREIRYSDILILCNKKSKMDEYLKEMRGAGIPVQLDGEISLEECLALGSFVRLFDYFTHPFDYAKKVGALEALRKNNHKQPELLLKEKKTELSHMSPFGIAEYLRYHLELLLPQEKVIDAQQVASSETKLQQMFEKVLSESADNGKMLSERFWEYCNSSLGRELALEKSGNAVRFMNLHKSKGLEGNIVILTKRDEKMEFRGGAFREGNHYYPAFANNFGRVQWNAYQSDYQIMLKAMTQEEEEQKRLEYVAVTRAKQALIVMDSISDTCMLKGCPLKNDQEVHSIEEIIKEAKSRESDKNYETYLADRQRVQKQESIYVTENPSKLEGTSNIRKKVPKEIKEKYRSEIRPKGNSFGNVMHRSLELLIERWREDFHQAPQSLEQMIHVCAKQAVIENQKDIRDEELTKYREFSKKVLKCFADWAYQEKLLINAKKVYTEMPFSYYKRRHEEIDWWMNGTADLIIENEDGSFQVLDYKSDYAPYLNEEQFNQHLKETYEGQLLEYRYAISRLFGIEASKISLTILSFAGDMEVTLKEFKFT